MPIINLKNREGFSIIEFVVASALLAILAGVAIVTMNPSGQLASARNSKRTADLNSIMMGVKTNISDYRTGQFTCSSAGNIPTSSKRMAVGAGNYDIAPCLVPSYMTVLPFDPSLDGARYVSNSDYDTGYMIIRNASTGQITISAPGAELGKNISVIR